MSGRPDYTLDNFIADLQRLAKELDAEPERNAMLEEAAKVCDHERSLWKSSQAVEPDDVSGGKSAAFNCAIAIRALKDQKGVQMDKPVESAPSLHPVVQECIDNYGKYYAEQHKLGMSVRSDMIYVAQLAIRWADNAAAGSGGQPVDRRQRRMFHAPERRQAQYFVAPSVPCQPAAPPTEKAGKE